MLVAAPAVQLLHHVDAVRTCCLIRVWLAPSALNGGWRALHVRSPALEGAPWPLTIFKPVLGMHACLSGREGQHERACSSELLMMVCGVDE